MSELPKVPPTSPRGAGERSDGTGEKADGVDVKDRLIRVVQTLSLARDLEKVMEIVRHAGRELTGADGVSFILRDGDLCYYADEAAIGPLWKGKRFPMASCISGWAMLHRQPAVIEDIYADPDRRANRRDRQLLGGAAPGNPRGGGAASGVGRQRFHRDGEHSPL